MRHAVSRLANLCLLGFAVCGCGRAATRTAAPGSRATSATETQPPIARSEGPTPREPASAKRAADPNVADERQPDPTTIKEQRAHQPTSKKTCSPDAARSHCIIIHFKFADTAAVSKLRATLAQDGIELLTSEGYSSVVATEDQLARIFHVKLSYQRAASSSGIRWACETNVESVRLPARYARIIASLTVGHQLCE